MNLWDIVILVVLAAVLVWALRSRRRAGASGSCCSAGCESCPGCAAGGRRQPAK